MYIAISLKKKAVRGFSLKSGLKVFKPGEQVILTESELKELYDNPRFRQLVIIDEIFLHDIGEEKPKEQPTDSKPETSVKEKGKK